MQDAPRIHRPTSQLADYTEIIGHWHGTVAYRSRALPRGTVTVIIDVGRRQLCCPATFLSRGTNIQGRWPRLAHDWAMDSTKQAVAATGLLVAAMRAEESARDDALFSDPFAERLAGDEGRRLLAESGAETAQPSAPIVVRTRLFDEALMRVHVDGVAQVVILAAGMDARSYRLPWHDGTTVYEVDQPQVIAIKDERLAGEQPRCRRVAVGVDLADNWPKVLQSQGFNSMSRTVWLIEGLLQYIDSSDVDRLFARVDALSAPVPCCCTTYRHHVIGGAVLAVHSGVHAEARCALGFRQ